MQIYEQYKYSVLFLFFFPFFVFFPKKGRWVLFHRIFDVRKCPCFNLFAKGAAPLTQGKGLIYFNSIFNLMSQSCCLTESHLEEPVN